MKSFGFEKKRTSCPSKAGTTEIEFCPNLFRNGIFFDFTICGTPLKKTLPEIFMREGLSAFLNA